MEVTHEKTIYLHYFYANLDLVLNKNITKNKSIKIITNSKIIFKMQK